MRTDYSMTAPARRCRSPSAAAGCRIETEDGRSYLDACGGAMVMLLGHCHPRVVEALERQVRRAQLHLPLLVPQRADAGARRAGARGVAPGDLEWCFFNSSGSEANESAMHLAVLYWELCGKPAKLDFLSRGDRRTTARRWAPCRCRGRAGAAPFEPLLHKYARRPQQPRPPRRVRPSSRPRSCRRGADHIAAFILEPVTGSSGAAVELPPGYLQAVRDVCDRYDVLLSPTRSSPRSAARAAGSRWSTTVRCRTSSRSARASAAASCRSRGWSRRGRCARSSAARPTGFPYGHTFSGYPLGCAVGCAVIDTIERRGPGRRRRRQGRTAAGRAGADGRRAPDDGRAARPRAAAGHRAAASGDR